LGYKMLFYHPPHGARNQLFMMREIVPTLSQSQWSYNNLLVLAIPKSTNMQSVSLNDTSKELETMGILQKSTQKNYLTLTASSVASLAKRLALRASEKDSKIPEGHSSLTLREYCEQNSLDYSSLKTLKDFSATTVDELLRPSSKRLMNWGMTANGKCLTARITESRKTGNGSTLSDILEEHPDPKYSLSQATTEKLLMKSPIKDSSLTLPDESQATTESEKTVEPVL